MYQNNKSVSKKKHYGREYYRRNKTERFIVHNCPHCNYETTGPKRALQAHIYAKHTPESERPFQCPEPNCNRGFAQKGGLEKHIEKVHGKKTNLAESREICLYIIRPGKYSPASNKTKNRCNYYKTHPVIKAKDLPIKLDDQHITAAFIRYDAREQYINLQTYKETELPNLQNKLLNETRNN